MANQEQLDFLKQGVEKWNQWSRKHPDTKPDFSDADLRGANLSKADLYGANFSRANLRQANLSEASISYTGLIGTPLFGADLSEANLSEANLSEARLWQANLYKADLSEANLCGADLRGANLDGANLRGANLSCAYLDGADLRGANLSEANLDEAGLKKADLSYADLSSAYLFGAHLEGANLMRANLWGAILRSTDLGEADLSEADLSEAALIGTNLTGATLTKCSVYGVSAWDVQLEGAKQESLVITREGEPTITVDNLEVAQFIYLLLNNSKIRDIINTLTTKSVLILGRFTPERKAILDAIRDELRKNDYLPILFDFDKPTSRDIHETITTLARLARFVIADITNPKSIPQELVSIVETLPSLPIQPLLKGGSKPWGMYDHIRRYPWVLPVYRYTDEVNLLRSLQKKVIIPAEQKAQELENR